MGVRTADTMPYFCWFGTWQYWSGWSWVCPMPGDRFPWNYNSSIIGHRPTNQVYLSLSSFLLLRVLLVQVESSWLSLSCPSWSVCSCSFAWFFFFFACLLLLSFLLFTTLMLLIFFAADLSFAVHLFLFVLFVFSVVGLFLLLFVFLSWFSFVLIILCCSSTFSFPLISSSPSHSRRRSARRWWGRSSKASLKL